jgi:hypothetical protein
MGRKLQVRNALTGETMYVDTDVLKTGPIRNRSLSASLLRRIREIHERIRDVYSLSLEQFEIGFMRDANPAREIAVWERIVASCAKVSTMLPAVDRKTVLRILLVYSMNGLTDADRNDALVRNILRIIENK